MKKCLFISNGHGEDLVAAEIIKQMPKEITATAFPLVGEGTIFKTLEIPVLGFPKKLPSGGFSLRNFSYLVRDLRSGLLGNLFTKLKTLRDLRGQFELIIAIGDIVPIIAALILKTPFIFVGVNKSSYYQWFGFNYTPWEKWLLRRYAKKVFARDEITATDLKRYGINAAYVGNPLMDCVEAPIQVSKEHRDPHRKVIGFLPGTRDDAALNLEDFKKLAKQINQLKDSSLQIEFIVATTLPSVALPLEKKSFVEVLERSNIVIGLSGTGNEQAAGYGIPVVSFYGRGSQYNKKFAQAQKQLLGEALYLIPSSNFNLIAIDVLQLLLDFAKLNVMLQTGKRRMGSSGAIKEICQIIKIMGRGKA